MPFILFLFILLPIPNAASYSEPTHRRLTLLAMPHDLGLYSYDATCPDNLDLSPYRSWLEKVIRQNIDGP